MNDSNNYDKMLQAKVDKVGGKKKTLFFANMEKSRGRDMSLYM